jgi:hypothetical protein
MPWLNDFISSLYNKFYVTPASPITPSKLEAQISSPKLDKTFEETPVGFAVKVYLSDPQSDSADYRACDDSIAASFWNRDHPYNFK